MTKKAVKRDPHLRIRIDPKLTAQLEKARLASGNTLTGEIVSRLEASFHFDDKVAIFERFQERRIEDVKKRAEELQRRAEEHEEERKRLGVMVEQANQNAAEIQEQVTRVEAQAAIVDALIGDDPPAREAIRTIALLLANNPGWAASTESVHKIALNITAAINTAAAKSTVQGG